MTIRDLLASASIDHLDAELLIAHVLEHDRAWVLAHDEEALSLDQETAIDQLMKRRSSGEPLAYITGLRSFYGRTFHVSPDVLIPRQSTEGLITLALEFLAHPQNRTVTIDNGIVAVSKVLRNGQWKVIVDVGTGSGCIAVTLALEGRRERIIGVDTSKAALKMAERNARKFGVESAISFMCEDGPAFIHRLHEPFVIVSNPPYVPSTAEIDTGTGFEPKNAVFAGSDGLDVIRPLVQAAIMNEACKGIVLELREDQA
jgi:release factor glutamine methyltransferase